MCWMTFRQENSKPKVADRPIKVFKVCRRDFGTILAYYHDKEYVEGVTYHHDGEIKDFRTHFENSTRYSINYGFHSYDADKVKVVERNLPLYTVIGGIRMLDVLYGNDIRLDYYPARGILVRAECTIPEGATYYENERGEFVSNAITINKIKTLNKTLPHYKA